ncbi:MAG: DNA repair protein RadA [Candidatus Muirbacterium halophilum]|nr:DNA repair protein RadA [Candidatus Muirbacterium halophilum]MCK9475964.1 DNA repair protein RadA [Candidatus Muirbacterium halophilum]
MFKCTECDFQSRQWFGKCPSCSEWNTFVELKEEVKSDNKGKSSKKFTNRTPKKINEISPQDESRFITGVSEFDSVLGGGIVKGSVTLVGGQPGIGKSTLLMQVAGKVAEKRKVLYITAEESESQVKMRAERLGIDNKNLFVLADYSLANILEQCGELKPGLVIIDSIQTLKSENVGTIPGTIGQVRECAGSLTEYAKTTDIPVILVAQINKEGNIAGPKHLEHVVDTVLYFDESKDFLYRVIRSIKNRFGPANEVGIFEMTSAGLINISKHVLIQSTRNIPGLQLVVSMEGVRPLVTEVQALVTETGFAMPQRMSEGFDRNRLMFLLAVLEKKCGLFFRTQDVFINIPGAIRLSDPGVELGVCMSILSSFYNQPVDSKEFGFIGEVGLTGEVRPVPYFDKRINELERLGVKQIITGKLQKVPQKFKDKIRPVQSVSELARGWFR